MLTHVDKKVVKVVKVVENIFDIEYAVIIVTRYIHFTAYFMNVDNMLIVHKKCKSRREYFRY